MIRTKKAPRRKHYGSVKSINWNQIDMDRPLQVIAKETNLCIASVSKQKREMKTPDYKAQKLIKKRPKTIIKKPKIGKLRQFIFSLKALFA
jgi:hypothetical protein